jgi:hypothetical protein
MVRANPWLVTGGGVFGLVAMLTAGAAAYWQYANSLPSYPTPTVVMPVPNGYDDFVAAGLQCHAAGGAELPKPPSPPPAAPAARPAAPLPGTPSAPPGNSGGWLGWFSPAPEAYLGTSGGSYPGPGGYPGSVSGTPAPTYQPPREACDPGAPLAQVRAVVRRNRAALARLRQGFRKQYRCPPVVSMLQTFPDLAYDHALVRVLVSEGKLAEREYRLSDAVRSYLDCLRMGVNVPRGGAVVQAGVGLWVQQRGLRPLQELAFQLDGPVAAAAAHEMTRLDAQMSSLTETLVNDRDAATACLSEYFRNSAVRRQLEDESSGIRDLLSLITPKRLVFNEIRGYTDALIMTSRQPYYAQVAPEPPSHMLSQMLGPVDDFIRFKRAVRDAQWRITELRLAIRAYQQAHGVLPPSLDALVPAYLPAVPQDPFAPGPMVYRRKARRALVYSRGPDGKDDGGADLGAKCYPDSRGDIVSLKGLRL